MKQVLNLSLFFILSFSALSAFGEKDYNEIDNIIKHFTYAWNECEGKGSADFYDEDADFVNIFGVAFTGKDEIEARHVKIHESFLKGSIFKVIETKTRRAKSDVAITHVHWQVTEIQIPGKEEMEGIFTHTLIKNKGRWKIVATQNTLISP